MSAALNFQFFFRFAVNARKEALLLFFVREVKKYLDGLGTVAMEMLLHIHNGLIPLLPEILFVAQLLRESLAAKNLRMHADDQHFLVIGPVKDPDPAAFRKLANCAPKEIVLQFLCTGLLETYNLTTCRIDSGHDVPNGAVFS